MTDAEFEQLNAAGLRCAQQKRATAKWLELIARRSLCRDCSREPEFYMVSRLVWQSAFKPGITPTGCLCLNCLERRLGRRLARAEIGNGGSGGLVGHESRTRQRKYHHDAYAGRNHRRRPFGVAAGPAAAQSRYRQCDP